MKNHQNNIPESGHTYTKYRFINETCILIYKKLGFTPLQVLKEIKIYIPEDQRSKLTFVGRLDPMAEGNIHILWSGDADEKKSITLLDKEYKIEVLIGLKTDTDDVLGLINNITDKEVGFKIVDLDKFVGPFEYDYPMYSSPHIKKVLKGEKDIELKKQDGYIYNIDFLKIKKVDNSQLKHIIFNKLNLCQMEGDFRLEQVKMCWNKFFKKNKKSFEVVSLRVKCRRGTYMRVLARELGGVALSIVRDC